MTEPTTKPINDRLNWINHKPTNGCPYCESMWDELCHWKEKEAIAQAKIVELQRTLTL